MQMQQWGDKNDVNVGLQKYSFQGITPCDQISQRKRSMQLEEIEVLSQMSKSAMQEWAPIQCNSYGVICSEGNSSK